MCICVFEATSSEFCRLGITTACQCTGAANLGSVWRADLRSCHRDGVDLQGNLYITGSTKSFGLATPGAFQTTPAGFGFAGGDAYVAKLDGDTLESIWVTYLGGSHSENGIDDSGGLAIGPGGTVIVTMS